MKALSLVLLLCSLSTFQESAQALTLKSRYDDVVVDKVPDRYKNGGDTFMESMYKTYSKPLLDASGKPIKGRFVMYKDSAYKAAQEVLETHKGLKG